MFEIEYKVPTTGARIARYRAMNGWTGAQLVAAIGSDRLTRSVLAKIERTPEKSAPRQDVGVSLLHSIAWALGVPPTALLLPIDRPDRKLQIGDVERTVWQHFEWIGGLPSFDGPPTPAGAYVQDVINGLNILARLQRTVEALRESERLELPEYAGIVEFEKEVAGERRILERLGVRFGEPDDDLDHHRITPAPEGNSR